MWKKFGDGNMMKKHKTKDHNRIKQDNVKVRKHPVKNLEESNDEDENTSDVSLDKECLDRLTREYKEFYANQPEEED